MDWRASVCMRLNAQRECVCAAYVMFISSKAAAATFWDYSTTATTIASPIIIMVIVIDLDGERK